MAKNRRKRCEKLEGHWYQNFMELFGIIKSVIKFFEKA